MGLPAVSSVVPSGVATLPLRGLSGRAWDLALVAVLEAKWRSMDGTLAQLSAAEREQVVTAVLASLIAERRLAADDADGRRLAAYAVRLELERHAAPMVSLPRRSSARAAGAPAADSPGEVRNLPVDFQDGWSIAVNDGRVVGTTNSPLVLPLRTPNGYYRSDLRDPATHRPYLVPRQVDLVYNFTDAQRTVSAETYTRTRRAQQQWRAGDGWPRGANPFDLEQVRAHMQSLPPERVFSRWQEYLGAFYLHAHSVDIQGAIKVGGMQQFDVRRLTEDTQGLVDDMLPARTGQRLLDCEFFAAITTHVFGGMRRPDGSRRFDTYWVILDTHAAAVVVERPHGDPSAPRRWAFVNNDEVMARGTTTVTNGLDRAIVDAVGRNILSGRPAIFAVETTHQAASRGATDVLVGPQVGANLYDGSVSRVSQVDRRAYWIFAETRPGRFSEHARHEDFVRSWSRYR